MLVHKMHSSIASSTIHQGRMNHQFFHFHDTFFVCFFVCLRIMLVCNDSVEIHCAMFVNTGILTFQKQKTWMSKPTYSWLTLLTVSHRVYPGHRNCHQDHTRNQSWRCHLACSKPCHRSMKTDIYLPRKLTYPPKIGRIPQGNKSCSKHPLIFRGDLLVSGRV